MPPRQVEARRHRTNVAGDGMNAGGPTTRSSGRAILLGTVLLPINALWLVQMEMGRSGGPYPTTFSLFANVIFWLAALLPLNRLVRKHAPKLALDSSELLILYVMLCLGSALTSVDFLDVLLPMIAHPAHFASPENGWTEHLLPHLPPGFAIRDAAAVEGYYEGHSTLYTARHLRAWLPPMALWSVFIFVLLATTFGLASLFRRRWIEHERLAFPILVLPVAMVDDEAALWRQPLLWQGFALAAGISLLNGLAFQIPAVPSIGVKYRNLQPLFTTRPWNALGWTPVSAYPFAIGLGYLLPSDLLFSCWFFYVAFKLQRLAGALLGLSGSVPRFPYVEEQCVGAYLLVALAAIWTGRHYLREVWATTRRSGPAPWRLADEALPYGWALALAAAGSAWLVWFFHWAGLPWSVSLGAMSAHLLIVLACARMRAELGPPAHDLHNAGPERLFTNLFGTGSLTPGQLTPLAYFYWFNRAYRSVPIAHQIESLKLAERSGQSARAMLAPLLVATVIGTLAGFWAHLHLGYTWGLGAKMAAHMRNFGNDAFGRLNSWLTTPTRPDVYASLAIAAGLLQALVLQTVRLRWASWPFHPLGFAVAGTWSMGTIWLPLLLAWVIKVAVMKYSGVKGYRRTLPFFLGLVLGDYLMGCTWPLYGAIVGVPTYSFQQ